MAYENHKTDARYQNRSAEGLPQWAELRQIDGHDYPLMATYATAEAAEAAATTARENGNSAQCFTSANPKFAPIEGSPGAYQPAAAAVYGYPRGHTVVVTAEGHEITERAKPEPKPKVQKVSKKAAKGTKTPAKKSK